MHKHPFYLHRAAVERLKGAAPGRCSIFIGYNNVAEAVHLVELGIKGMFWPVPFGEILVEQGNEQEEIGMV